jgi:hypothetical protein
MKELGGFKLCLMNIEYLLKSIKYLLNNNLHLFKEEYDLYDNDLCLTDCIYECFDNIMYDIERVLNNDYYKNVIIKDDSNYDKYNFNNKTIEEYDLFIKSIIIKLFYDIEKNICYYNYNNIEKIYDIKYDFHIIKNSNGDLRKKPKINYFEIKCNINIFVSMLEKLEYKTIS